MRRQREFCTDALAVRLTGDPLALAGALESVARLRLSFRASPAAASSLGGQTISLLPRIQELIGMMPSRPRPPVWPFAALPAAGFVALIAAATGLSQEKPIADRLRAPLTIAQVAPESVPRQGGVTTRIAVWRSAKSTTPADLDRQICFEIRYLSLDANPWREAVKDGLEMIKQEADVCAWIIGEKPMSDLLTLAQGDTRSNVLQAPNVTNFENVHSLVSNTYIQKYVSQVEKVEKANRLAFRPIIKECELGSRIDVVGSLKAGATAIAVEVRDSSLLSLHTLVRKETFRDQTYAADYQVPTPIERSCRVSCELPDNKALLVSMGLHERRSRLSNAGEAASGLLEAVGLPPVPARMVTCERLVMIRPRRIVLEPEKPPITGIKGSFDGKTR